jgi:hypothetical protein
MKEDSAGATDCEALRRENEALLRELEHSYAQLAAVLQVSQDETRIAYAELQEKLVVQEKKLVELAFLGGALDALLEERDTDVLRRTLLDKICLLVPVDLALLAILPDLEHGLQRERDVVRETTATQERCEAIEAIVRRVEQGGRAVWLVPDLDADPSAAPLRLRPDALSAACLALRARGQLIGVLLLNARLRANFRDDQEPLLGTYAHHAAAALDHAIELRHHRAVLAELARRHGWTDQELADAVRIAQRSKLNPKLDAVARAFLRSDDSRDPVRPSSLGTELR